VNIRQRAVRRVAVVTEPPDRIYDFVDELVVVDDGSNEGYQTAFGELRRRVRVGELNADDIVYLFDAGAQPELLGLDRLHQLMVGEGLDALLVGTDLSGAPAHKRAGNYARSAWSSLWAGGHLPNVESGCQIFRIGALAHALDYCRGYGYPEIVELAVVLKRLGYRVRADILVPLPVHHSRMRIKDVAADFTTIPRAAWRSTRPLGIFGRLRVLARPAVVTAAPVAAAIALRRVNSRRR
jgi:hypothetical protein